MAMLSEIRIPSTPDVQTEALNLLITQLGPAKAAFFLRDRFSRHTDYLEYKDNIFGNETVADLVQQIKAERGHKLPKS